MNRFIVTIVSESNGEQICTYNTNIKPQVGG